MEAKAFKSLLKVDYKKPLNFRDQWAHLFKPDYAYLNVELKVKELKNVFVSHYGLVLKNGLLVKGCAPNIGHTRYNDENKYFIHWKLVLEQMLVCKFGKSLESINLSSNNKYLIIHSPWFSYYFWITECLPRLLTLKNRLSEIILIYPEEWESFTFVNETLSNFPNLRIEKIKKDVHLFIPNLVLPQVKPWTPMFIPEQIIEVRTLLLELIKKENVSSPFGDKIYISRKNASRKKFTDENFVESFLNQLGFDCVCMEDFSFKEQIAIMNKAKEVVAITGAGTINALFMESGGLLIDIPHRDYITKSQYKFHFFKMCNIINVNYSVFFADRVDDPNVDHYSKQNLIFEKDEFFKFYREIKENA